MTEFNLTFFEVCEKLNRSKKSITRYIRRGQLHPQKVKSQQGTLEYRFSLADLEAFKAQETAAGSLDTPPATGTPGETGQTRQDRADRPEGTEETGQRGQGRQDTPQPPLSTNEGNRPGGTEGTRPDRPDGTGQTGHQNEIITLLKETTELLRDQLKTKDGQIKDLGGKIDQLIERDRETNIILKGLQDRVLMLSQDTRKPPAEATELHPDHTGLHQAEPAASAAIVTPAATQTATPAETSGGKHKRGLFAGVWAFLNQDMGQLWAFLNRDIKL